jgi:hypothetical protein
MMQKFEMKMMGELTYFLGFQVKQLKDDTFISKKIYPRHTQEVWDEGCKAYEDTDGYKQALRPQCMR